MAYTDLYDPYYSNATLSGYMRYTYDGKYGGVTVSWEAQQNYPENTSTITFFVRAPAASPGVPISVIFDYQDANAETQEYLFPTADTVYYHQMTVKHNKYGQRYVSVTVYDDRSSWGTAGFRITTIPQGARLENAPTTFNDEENPTIEYYAYQSGAQAVITTNTNTEELDIVVSHIPPTTENTTTYTFELSEAERDELRLRCKNSKSMKLFFGMYCIVNGEVLFTYKETSFSVINANPTATGTVKDINPVTIALTGDENTLIRFVSTASVAAQFTAIKKAAISGFWIEHNSNIFPETTHIFEKVEGNIFGFHITDSRGNVGESFIQAPMIEYLKLTCNIDTSQKPNTDGEMNLHCSGNFFNDTFGYTSSAAANTLQVQYRYKKQGGEYGAWATLPHTINDDGTYDAAIVLSGFVYTDTYIFQCRAIDRLSDVQSIEYTARALPVFHWGENDFVFEVPVTFNAPTTGIEHPAPPPDYTYGGEMGGDLDIDGNLSATGDIFMPGEAKGIYFGEDSDSFIAADAENDLEIKTNILNIDATLWLKGQPIEFGVWYPVFSKDPAIYAWNNGWYQRVGNVVTVGFHIKAEFDSDDVNLVEIDGLPYTPAQTAVGGGLCSGCEVSGGFNFQCWSAGTDGIISARVQSCNNTTTTKLATSGSGLVYPTSGEVTVGGTITYMVE